MVRSITTKDASNISFGAPSTGVILPTACHPGAIILDMDFSRDVVEAEEVAGKDGDYVFPKEMRCLFRISSIQIKRILTHLLSIRTIFPLKVLSM
jgi:hypothetical protein